MLDAYIAPKLKPILLPIVKVLDRYKIHANHLTLVGFVFGIIGAILISMNCYLLGLMFILINRLFDGLDGALARLTQSQSASGGFLDICLDFLFYASIPLAFAIANPQLNGLSAAILLATFIGTGSSFLAFAISAERFAIKNPVFSYKSFYYLNGLTEGTETILFFCAFCLWPMYFPILALIFSVLAGITIITRIYFGFQTIKQKEQGAE
ncbi:CDP-alcohol phosphatidyltransferase family protein [Thorsellia anophelis]|uniref:Phosphatidylglycerophosphate synthase n=1 Tax=Thorsellia anophelis DSM 18579 TaxID=1123402 RepID=A0A1H9YPU3_9GAMM|nr:CDP-alcohol phosphatidyltransferase family protein [Thorsellia anophelis]SES71066.1 Phosphatidylglycerophosphate synthase [Thorsellia anophelis DSM 18579]